MRLLIATAAVTFAALGHSGALAGSIVVPAPSGVAASVGVTSVQGSAPAALSPSTSALPSLAESSPSTADMVTRLLAGVGLVLGLINLVWTFLKSKRDRRLSVEDDFWFRKVVTPASIEPMLEMLVGLLKDMPSENAPQEDVKAFALRVTSEFQVCYARLQMLALLTSALPEQVNNLLRGCEDVLSEYASSIARREPIKSDVGVAAWRAMNAALSAIKSQQLRH